MRRCSPATSSSAMPKAWSSIPAAAGRRDRRRGRRADRLRGLRHRGGAEGALDHRPLPGDRGADPRRVRRLAQGATGAERTGAPLRPSAGGQPILISADMGRRGYAETNSAAGLPIAAAPAARGALGAAQDAAAGYPDKPVTIIVPFAAGGNTDAFARLVGAGAGHGPGPAVHRREQGRRRRQSRRGPARPLRARRLHAGHGHGQHPRDQSHALQEPALRPGHGLRADLAVRDAAQRADRQSEASRRRRSRS